MCKHKHQPDAKWGGRVFAHGSRGGGARHAAGAGNGRAAWSEATREMVRKRKRKQFNPDIPEVRRCPPLCGDERL